VPDEEFGELDFTMTLKGKERRSLERAMEIETSVSGSIQFSGSYVEDGLHRVPLHVRRPHRPRQGHPPLISPRCKVYPHTEC
jgi:hypothetical protein